MMMFTIEHLAEPRAWVLTGSTQAVETVLKRVAQELRHNEIRFSLRDVTMSEERPGLALFVASSGSSRQAGLLFVEELPYSRCQLRIPSEEFNPNVREVAEGALFVEYVNAAVGELNRLGFVVAASGSLDFRTPGQGSSDSFTAEEQDEIIRRLESLERFIVDQFELSREQITFVERELAGLREEVRNQSRWSWAHLARSVFYGIAGSLGGLAAKQVAEQAIEMLRPFLGDVVRLITGE